MLLLEIGDNSYKQTKITSNDANAFLFTTIKVKNPMTFCKAFITILTLPICFSTKLVTCLHYIHQP